MLFQVIVNKPLEVPYAKIKSTGAKGIACVCVWGEGEPTTAHLSLSPINILRALFSCLSLLYTYMDHIFLANIWG